MNFGHLKHLLIELLTLGLLMVLVLWSARPLLHDEQHSIFPSLLVAGWVTLMWATGFYGDRVLLWLSAVIERWDE
jgi:hypothetical protein